MTRTKILTLLILPLAVVAVLLGALLTRDKDLTPAQMLASTVKIELTHTVDVTVKPVDCADCEPEVFTGEEVGGTGSGFVASVHDTSSLIVTAGHVCDDWKGGSKTQRVDSWFGELEVTMTTTIHELTIVNIKGEKFTAVVVEADEDHDTCIIATDSAAVGPAVKLASSTPKAGEKIVHTGAPMGLWDRDAGAVVDGRSMGVHDLGEWGTYMGMMLSSIGGSSGGPVWYDNEVVGILVLSSRPDGDITFAVQSEYLRGELIKAEATWLRMNTR